MGEIFWVIIGIVVCIKLLKIDIKVLFVFKNLKNNCIERNFFLMLLSYKWNLNERNRCLVKWVYV